MQSIFLTLFPKVDSDVILDMVEHKSENIKILKHNTDLNNGIKFCIVSFISAFRFCLKLQFRCGSEFLMFLLESMTEREGLAAGTVSQYLFL